MDPKRCYGCMQLKQNSPVCEHCGYDERRPNAPHQLPPGTTLQGKYLIGRVLGQGGFGITYLGRDIQLDIPVAIKEYYPTGMVVRENYLSHSVTVVTDQSRDTRFAENRDRFLREARTLAKLQDVPEVVQVMNFFEENNTAYIVMGYVRGITLKDHMRRSGGKLSAREVFRLLEPVMEGLSQVHELGLVHRDISPDNIMLQPNKRARLIDFGAAHAATSGDKSTQAVLKHGFAPLEQYQSKGNLGPWTDVYAMCATVYHCITGLMPPNATDRVVGDDEFCWDALTGLTPGQRSALQQGLAPQYKQRIQTMEELCRKLFDLEEELPPQSKPIAPVSETGTVLLGYEPPAPVPTPMPVRNPAPASVAPSKPIYTAPVDRSFPAFEVKSDPVSVDKDTIVGQPPKKKFWPLVVAVVLVALAVFILTSNSKATPIPNGSRVLMVHNDTKQTAFRTNIERKQVASITFLNTNSAPTNAVDASESQDGSVLAWVEPNGEFYDLYLAANGNIIAPENCSYMFCGFSSMESIDLSGFDTTHVTNMNYMFFFCKSLSSINLYEFNTSLVEDMSHMFNHTDKLKNVDGNLDVQNVKNYDRFMDTNDTFNGKRWGYLFR